MTAEAIAPAEKIAKAKAEEDEQLEDLWAGESSIKAPPGIRVLGKINGNKSQAK